jgi:Ca2+-binding EF-hand superfamily protein
MGILEHKLHRAFGLLDADGDGRLTEADLTGLADHLAAAFDVSDETAKIARLKETLDEIWRTDLQSMDPAGTGLDATGFTAGILRAVENDREGFVQRFGAMAQAWLDIGDTDGNGVLSQEEFTLLYTRVLGVAPDDLAAAFAALDLDGDGSLDRYEIQRAAEEYYTSDDADARGNWLFGPPGFEREEAR